MAVVKQEKSEKGKQENLFQYRVTPRYTAWTEEDKIILRVVLPGVNKENIEMKVLKDYFLLRAHRDSIIYKLDLDLNVEVVPDKTKTEYKEGLLRIEFTRYNPLDDAYDVPIN